MRFAVLCSVPLLAVAACQQASEPASAPPAAAPSPAAPTGGDVLTSAGLGPLRVGMTVDELAGVWGGPRAPLADPQACNIVEFGDGPPGVQAMTQDGRVVHVILNRFSTQKSDRGFGPNDPGAAVKAAYGAAADVTPAKYDPPPAEEIIVWSPGVTRGAYVQDPAARGIRYSVSGDGQVSKVAAGGPSIQLVEGCS